MYQYVIVSQGCVCVNVFCATFMKSHTSSHNHHRCYSGAGSLFKAGDSELRLRTC